MSVRIYLDKSEDVKITKFKKKMKNLGASYIEKGVVKESLLGAVFKMPKIVGKYRAAVAVDTDMNFNIGQINKSCDNFERGNGCSYNASEAPWIVETLSRIFKVSKR